VAILTHFDAATIGAANAFLKTLEEPPGNVVLLLTATEAEAVLPTISSRCHIIALRPLPVATIEAALVTRWAAAKPEAKRLAHFADGRLGWAVRAQNNPSMLAVRHENLQLLQEVLGQGLVERFSSAEALANEPEDLPSVLRLWAGWWRDLALVAYGRILNAVVNIEYEAELQAFAEQWKPAEISAALESTETAVSQLRANANARLVMENLLLGYPDCDGG
jgi:DNA polymerase-3 subunit delta'